MASSDARTILLALVLLTIIFAGKITDGINKEGAGAFNEKIMLTSIRDTVVATFAQEIPSAINSAAVVTTIPAPAQKPATPAEISNGDVAAPTIGAIAGIAAHIGTEDAPLWEKNITQRWPVASLTKLMSAVIIDETVGRDKQITIAEEDMSPETLFHDVNIGEMFSVDDLRALMLLRSSNDAAYAIARFHGAKQFVDAMQQRASEIGMINTSFFDPAGLSSLNQSTLRDLGKLADYIWKNHRDIFSLSTNKEIRILEKASGIQRVIRSNNEFAGNEKFLGGKTGYTDEAHGNLISLFDTTQGPLLIIVLGTDDRFGDTKRIFDWITTQKIK